MFLPDPLDVPLELVEYLAEQLGIDDPSCVKSYVDRRMTRFERSASASATHSVHRDRDLAPDVTLLAELVSLGQCLEREGPADGNGEVARVV
jgi:hypothetical protein